MVITFKTYSKLTKREREIFVQCMGQCSTCLCEGGCDLEKKLKK